MARNHYDVLGVAPTSEDVVIRAAYRALMRRYHPDTDRTGQTAERAREINAAYAVLSDPDKRARYDGSLAAAGLIKPHPEPRSALSLPSLPSMPRSSPAAIAGIAVFAGLFALIAISPPLAELPGAPAILGETPARRAPAAEPAPPSAPAAAQIAARACEAQAAHDAVKAELFRRAARLGGRDAKAFAGVAERSLARIQGEPAAVPQMRGTVRCDGWLALDLPDGLMVEGARTNLNSEVHFALAQAGAGKVRLAGLDGTETLVGSLATLARASGEPEPDVEPAPPPVATPAPELLPPPQRRLREAPPPPPTIVSKPAAARVPPPSVRPAATVTRPNQASFSCRYARGRSEKAICGSSNLAALDRHLALFYSQSLGAADTGRKDALVTSNERFTARRNSCRSEKCLTTAYVARMREVSEIMARKAQP